MQNVPREEGENNFLTLLNFIVDPVVIANEKGRVLLVNDAFEDVTGLSSSEVIGKIFSELRILTAESKKALLENLNRRMQGLPVSPYEITFTAKNGEIGYAEVKAKKISYAGNPADLVIIRDITRIKKNLAKIKEYSEKMETLVSEKVKEIKESEERCKELTESISDVFFAMDKNLRYTYWNKASEKLRGIRAKDAIGKSMTEVFRDAEGTEFEKIYRDVIRTKRPKNFVNKYKIRDKEYIFEINVYPTKAGLSVFVKDITERKQIEEKIRETEKHFRETLDNMIEGCQIISHDWRYLYVNDSAAKHAHLAKEELLGKTMMEVYPGIEKSKMFAELQQCMQKRVSKLMENEFTYPDGRKSWFELRIHPAPEGIFVLSIDITDRKQMETKLLEGEKRYRTLFNQAPVGILIIEQETARAIEFNEEAHRQLGYTREEFEKLTVSDYEVLETPEETKARMKKILREGKDEFETKHRTKTGEIRDVINTVQVIELAGKKFFHLITRDITEQKKIEHELRLERDKLETITENIGAGLAIISKDYRILWANKLLNQTHGGRVENKLCYSTFNKLTQVCPDCGVKKVFENGVPMDIHEYTNKNDKGNQFWIELIVTPIKDKDGNVLAALELAVDITEKKRMQNELAKYSEKLEQLVEERTEQLKQTQAKLLKAEKLAAIGELAGMVGHDLRNPLTGIKGATYYLKTKHGTEIGEKGKQMLETIEKAIDHSNKIVNDLLEYSSKPTLELGETTPKQLLQKALALIEIPQRIQIIDATENNPNIKADTDKMRKVFVNIITNAIDAIQKTGTVTIESNVEGDNVKFVFTDTGTGMTEETLSKLKLGFPLFTTKAKGMGFGLPICKRIVEAHGGRISLTSKPKKGTTVTITIPTDPKPVGTGEEKWIFNESALWTIKTTPSKTP
ncbi:MAG: PAS domain S-box protein [Candidatus Bathyarchaeota archaeon]|nr:PAS domain S-box protein [Candidatus Bathyarchaeota archaeon]